MDFSFLTNLTFWTNLSIIWLAFLGFILTLVPLVIFYFAMRGMLIVNRTVPRYLKLGQYYSGIVRDQTTRVSLKVAEPMVRAHGEAARTQAFLQVCSPNETGRLRPLSLKKRKRNREPQDTSAAHRRRRWRIPGRLLCLDRQRTKRRG